ncbi:MAG: hypothetical protein KJ710_05830 [Candidatus Omnitrophica bacterium]|nr:hypothetical protein [Candidatus Omnitrophota bacterium]MBU1923755.1 hypothetical protein [Candidatus Omnitrophota bacterium]
MKLRNVFKFIIAAIIICLLFIFPGFFYAQIPKDPGEANEAKTAIEQALNNYQAQKQNEQDELTAQLNFRLGQATESWLTAAKKNRDNQLGTFIEQNWDKQARTYMITPVRYDYYLRGYKYSVTDSDVIKTDSMTSPYKAIVVINEELYAEKYHHPNISDTKLYYYTVTNIYTLDFAYKDEEFELVSTDSKMAGIVNEISNKARRQWIK